MILLRRKTKQYSDLVTAESMKNQRQIVSDLTAKQRLQEQDRLDKQKQQMQLQKESIKEDDQASKHLVDLKKLEKTESDMRTPLPLVVEKAKTSQPVSMK